MMGCLSKTYGELTEISSRLAPRTRSALVHWPSVRKRGFSVLWRGAGCHGKLEPIFVPGEGRGNHFTLVLSLTFCFRLFGRSVFEFHKCVIRITNRCSHTAAFPRTHWSRTHCCAPMLWYVFASHGCSLHRGVEMDKTTRVCHCVVVGEGRFVADPQNVSYHTSIFRTTLASHHPPARWIPLWTSVQLLSNFLFCKICLVLTSTSKM